MQFPDIWPIRLLLRLSFLTFDLIAPLSFLWCAVASLTFPAPPIVIFLAHRSRQDIEKLFEQYHHTLQAITWFCVAECCWFFIHRLRRSLISSGIWDLRKKQDELLKTEERFRLWVKMLESSDDPWEWLEGMFTMTGSKVRDGMRDPAVTSVKIDDIGKRNMQEWIAHYLFQKRLDAIKPKSIERAELRSMLLLLEAKISILRGEDFHFLKTKSRHHTLLVSTQPMNTVHHPLLFYFLVFVASGMGNIMLYSAGFRFYGRPRLFPLFFMRRSGKALDRLLDPTGRTAKNEDARLADKIGYWYHPGSQRAQEDGLAPVLFFHGVSGTYGPSLLIILLLRWSGRAFFVPEYPYVTMRYNSPSSIVGPRETAAAVRRMLNRHGYGLPDPEDGDSSDDEEWRKGRAILCGHSLGSGPCAWLLRSAPSLVAGLVLVDPMSLFLYAADSPRNFLRTSTRTAGEMFFRYFTTELGIMHYLSRHMKWTEAVLFASEPAFPLPPAVLDDLTPKVARTALNPPFDVPNYAPSISPCPEGPFPSIVFFSELDSVIPSNKIIRNFKGAGFDSTNLRVLKGADHAAIVVRPSWIRQIAEAINQVGTAAEAVERRRWEEMMNGE